MPRDEPTTSAGPPVGPLVVAFVPGVTPGKWERLWRERYPRRRLELEPTPQQTALARLRDGSAHMALLREVAADDEFHVIRLYSELTVVVAPRDHPVKAFDALTLADLGGETLLEASADDAGPTLDLVEAGVGLALLPMSVARAQSRRSLVARPVSDAPETAIGLAWPIDGAHPAADDFVGIVRGRTARSSRS